MAAIIDERYMKSLLKSNSRLFTLWFNEHPVQVVRPTPSDRLLAPQGVLGQILNDLWFRHVVALMCNTTQKGSR